MSGALLAGVELGGTKSIAVLSDGETILEKVRVETGRPQGTLDALAQALAGWRARHDIAALGIGSFGPIALDRSDPGYGRMNATPKSGWTGVDVVAPLASAVGTSSVMLHTDVTAAALAERRWNPEGLPGDLVYMTVGTGIGVGILVDGKPVTGALHPEAGHMRVRRSPGDDFVGVCPFHGDCLEGLASGPAVAARAGAPAAVLAPDDPVWALVADALAESIAGLLLTLSTKAVLLGGGLALGQPQLMPLIRQGVRDKLAGYLSHVDAGDMADLIRPAGLGADAGPLGTIALAHAVLNARQ